MDIIQNSLNSHSNEQDHVQLKRELKNRHIQLIALGGAIGTGLFYGSTEAIGWSGPSVLLTYIITGIIIFFVMRQMGEMIVDEPVSGSFSYFASKYWGPFPGFLSGWNYWLSYVIVNMIELTAISAYINYWFPHIPPYLCAFVLFIMITTVNLVQVKLFGEMEFWFSMIKIVTIIAFIGIGVLLIGTGHGGPDAHISNLWAHGGFFPHGVSGLLSSIAVVIFAYGGTELIGVAAGETKDPSRSIPKAINHVMIRILIFYVGALTVALILIPWDKLKEGVSPFVQVFDFVGIPFAASLVNFVLITAIISAYNSGLYSNARMLYSMAEQGDAPKVFGKINKQGVPVNGVLFSSALIGTVVFLQYFFPIATLFNIIIAFSVACDTLNRIMIIITHLKFKKAKKKAGLDTQFKSPWYPVVNYICLAFMAAIFIIILCYLDVDDYKRPILWSPLWVVFLFFSYRIKSRNTIKS